MSEGGQPREDILKRAETLLSKRIFDKYAKLKKCFQARDYNGNGTLSYADFRQLLRDLGIPAFVLLRSR